MNESHPSPKTTSLTLSYKKIKNIFLAKVLHSILETLIIYFSETFRINKFKGESL